MEQDNLLSQSKNQPDPLEFPDITSGPKEMDEESLLPKEEQLKREPVKSLLDSDNEADKKDKKFKPKFLWGWILILVALVILFFLLVKFCQLIPWWLALLLLLDYLLLLIINYLKKFKKDLWWLWGILLAVMPVIVLLFCGSWTWWLWLLVIGLYIITLMVYFLGLLLQKFWPVIIPLSLFLILMLVIFNICLCQ